MYIPLWIIIIAAIAFYFYSKNRKKVRSLKTDNSSKTSEAKISEFTDRNRAILQSFIDKITKVEVGLPATYEDYLEKTKSLPLSKEFYTGVMNPWRPFWEYAEIMKETINEIAAKEKVDNFKVREEEFIPQWYERVKQLSDNRVWLQLFADFQETLKEIHNEKVKERWDEVGKKRIEREESERVKNDLILEDFINNNKDYVDFFLSETKRKESQVNKYGLFDKTIFQKELNNFITKLANHYGYKSFKEIDNYYPGFVEDLSKKLEKIYKEDNYEKVVVSPYFSVRRSE